VVGLYEGAGNTNGWAREFGDTVLGGIKATVAGSAPAVPAAVPALTGVRPWKWESKLVVVEAHG
jgi:hypothetical protein